MHQRYNAICKVSRRSFYLNYKSRYEDDDVVCTQILQGYPLFFRRKERAVLRSFLNNSFLYTFHRKRVRTCVRIVEIDERKITRIITSNRKTFSLRQRTV